MLQDHISKSDLFMNSNMKGGMLMSPRNVVFVFCVFATCEISSLLVDCCYRYPFFSSCFLVLSCWFSFCPSHVVGASLLLTNCFGGRLCATIQCSLLARYECGLFLALYFNSKLIISARTYGKAIAEPVLSTKALFRS
jgi:hypothetical protein